jgi:hypothetical protein
LHTRQDTRDGKENKGHINDRRGVLVSYSYLHIGRFDEWKEKVRRGNDIDMIIIITVSRFFSSNAAIERNVTITIANIMAVPQV